MLERVYTLADMETLEGDYELDEGRLVPMTPPKWRHGRTCMEVGSRLREHCRRTGQGMVLGNDTGFILSRDPDTLRGPDVSVIVTERLAGLPEDGWPEGAPDLAVEVVSPSNTPGALQHKVGQFLQARARLVWVLYPIKRIAIVYDDQGGVQILGEDQELTGEPVLPGFRCRVGDLF